ncbi:MAG: diaminopimelate epimerase [Fimbriimonadaceae bacterium]
MTVPFWKVQSTGNHFVLIEPQPGWPEERLVEFVIRASRPHFGIGSDGVLVLARAENGLQLRMFNPDGTEDFCGNGLRCAAVFGRLRGFVNSDQFVISHLGREVQVTTNGPSARTTLQSATYDPLAVPHLFGHEMVNEQILLSGVPYRIHAISTGSTHVVLPVAKLPEDEQFFAVSRELEHHPMFPERTSAMWMQELSENQVRLRIWERGAGETMGCGTGSTASAVAYCRERGACGQIQVHNPGGTVQVELATWDAAPTVTGEAEILFEGQFEFAEPRG